MRERERASAGAGGVVRLGELMVRAGLITEAQRREILEIQGTSGRPFGDIAEREFGVDPKQVEWAWAAQYASAMPLIDPRQEHVEVDVLKLVGRREAWQFRVLPIRRDGAEVMVCTTPDHLVRALKFLGWSVRGACYMVLAEPDALHEALARYYPMAGLGPKSFRSGMLRAKRAAGLPKLRA